MGRRVAARSRFSDTRTSTASRSSFRSPPPVSDPPTDDRATPALARHNSITPATQITQLTVVERGASPHYPGWRQLAVLPPWGSSRTKTHHLSLPGSTYCEHSTAYFGGIRTDVNPAGRGGRVLTTPTLIEHRTAGENDRGL